MTQVGIKCIKANCCLRSCYIQIKPLSRVSTVSYCKNVLCCWSLIVEDLSDESVRIWRLVVDVQVCDVLQHQRQELIVAQQDLIVRDHQHLVGSSGLYSGSNSRNV